MKSTFNQPDTVHSSNSNNNRPTLDRAGIDRSSSSNLCDSFGSITLPAVRIAKRVFFAYCIIFLVVIIATADTFRTFIINERALLTSRGRERHRTRRRFHRKSKLCDESDEPPSWRIFQSGWRKLSSCQEYDLSLRRTPLGDIGVYRLVKLLGHKEYATKNYNGQLRVLNLQRQGITRRGAGYLARWLSTDPIELDEEQKNNEQHELADVERIPTAAYKSIFINLEGNPIGDLGVKDLDRAVDKARINGIAVTIVGGGSNSDSFGKNGAKKGAHHVVKLGPIEYSKRSVDMPPWRLPVTVNQKLKKVLLIDNPILPSSVKGLVVFVVGILVGRLSIGVELPYRLELVRNDRLIVE